MFIGISIPNISQIGMIISELVKPPDISISMSLEISISMSISIGTIGYIHNISVIVLT